MLRKPFIAGNWKMHLGPADAERFFARFSEEFAPADDRTVAFFPPAITFGAAKAALGSRADIRLGVQNVHWEEKGAFTGETSAALAASAGAEFALIGHSERRSLFGETDEETARKTSATLAAGITPVLCVGELLEERERGEAGAVVERQLSAVYDTLSDEQADAVVIAYEPVWAIGTGRTASPDDAAEMHARIRAFLAARYGADRARAIPILYGGSVKPDNAANLLAAGDVDGLLVGGASLDPEGFARVCSASG